MYIWLMFSGIFGLFGLWATPTASILATAVQYSPSKLNTKMM